MQALTIDAIYAWAILAGHKQIENRTWTTSHRGRLAIHAGKSNRRDGEALRLLERLEITPPGEEILQGLRGRILGAVNVVDVVAYDATTFSENRWATGPYCWLLENPVWLNQAQEASGRLGLWPCEFTLSHQAAAPRGA